MDISKILELISREKSLEEISEDLNCTKSEIKQILLSLSNQLFHHKANSEIKGDVKSDGIINVYTDGAVSGNPGPGGIGVVIYNSINQEIACGNKYIGDMVTNNIAEYKALIFSFEFIEKLTNISKINFYSDSELLVKQINGQYKVSNPSIYELYLDFFEKVKVYKEFKLEHIFRDKNKRADQLAVEAKMKGMKLKK